MRGFLIKLTLAFLFLSCASAACVNAQKVPKTNEQISASDLSTDEAVIAELQKIKDAKNAALTGEDEKIAAKRRAIKLDTSNVCIKRFKESARVIVIGAFKFDYGCHFEGAFVDSRLYDATDFEIHRNALEAFGWQKASQAERERLAKLWVEKGLLAFFTVLQTKVKELKKFDAHPPRVVADENGGIKVTLWFQTPPKMRRGKSFQHVEYRFKADGTFSGTSPLAAVVL